MSDLVTPAGRPWIACRREGSEVSSLAEYLRSGYTPRTAAPNTPQVIKVVTDTTSVTLTTKQAINYGKIIEIAPRRLMFLSIFFCFTS